MKIEYFFYLLLPPYQMFNNVKLGEGEWVKTTWNCSFRGPGQQEGLQQVVATPKAGLAASLQGRQRA